MPATTPVNPETAATYLGEIGHKIRNHRKALRVNATTAAQAAGLSRVTLHRIETGSPSVTIGAYMNVLAALGLVMNISELPKTTLAAPEPDRHNWIPARVPLADYPQLKQLAWQVHGTDTLTPIEALSIYERNWRHLDLPAMTSQERHLVDALRLALGEVQGQRRGEVGDDV